MDFSKVRLADFAQARLRNVASREQSPEVLDSPQRPAAKNSVSEVCAHAPQYSVSFTPLVREAVVNPEDLRDVQLDANSGYSLAVTSQGVLVWKQGATNSLLFPLPESHAVTALLVPASADMGSVQPGLVAVDCDSGNITYWESINRAVSATSGSSTLGHSTTGLFGTETARIHLGRKEYIEFVESVPPIGLVAVTNQGHFYLINLRDDMGKRNVAVSEMRAGSGLFARLRSMGSFARDISAIHPGRLVNQDSTREVFIVNRYGGIAVWHVGLNGCSELIDEVRVGEKLCAQMNMIYPNCEISLVVHDMAIEDSYSHVLASFAPQSDSNLRYFVVMSLNQEFEVVSVRRLQACESLAGIIGENTSLQVGNGVLLIAEDDAIALLDSPSRLSSVNVDSGIGAFRWEECVALKPAAKLLSSFSNADGSVCVATTMGVLRFEFPFDRTSESTTKTRLEQAVFESQVWNPLDLNKWPSFEALADEDAPKQLAIEIANSKTPYVPAQLPNLKDHLNLRASKLQDLFKQAPIPEVREIAQVVVAATAAFSCYESVDSTGQEIQTIVDSALKSVRSTGDINLRQVLLNDITIMPDILHTIALNALTQGSARLILEVFQACNANGLGIPKWISQGAMRQALESLTSQAADARDPLLLAQTTEMLCAVYADNVENTSNQFGADCSTIKQLLHELSMIEGMNHAAITIANNYHVYSALAPMEVAIWVADAESNGTSSEGLDIVSKHIDEFGERYSTAVFEACVSSGKSSLLVKELAPKHRDLVNEYLTSRKLHTIAWTLEPGTSESTSQLEAATRESKTLDERRIYASLFKLSAYTTRSGNLGEAQLELDIVTAQESLAYQLYPINELPSSYTSSKLIQHGVTQLEKLLDRDTAVDLLALAPPQAVPETNNNFVLGFKIVDAQDLIRQRLLIQQLVCNTNWDRVASSPEPLKTKRMKQTLFSHTLNNVPAAYRALIQNFRSSLIVPDNAEIKRSYRWDVSGSVVEELEKVAQRAASIADKYGVDELVRELMTSKDSTAKEEQMDVDN